MEDGRIRCRHCGMTFAIGCPPTVRTEVTYCAEGICRRRMWSTLTDGPARCGMYPEDVYEAAE